MVVHLRKGLGWLAKLLGHTKKAMQPACLLGHEAGGVAGSYVGAYGWAFNGLGRADLGCQAT